MLKNRIFFFKFSNYFLARVVIGFISFISIPLIAKYLTIENYGIVSLFTTISTFVTLFCGLDMSTILSVKYFTDSREQLIKLCNQIVTLIISFSLFLFLLFIFTGKKISVLLGFNDYSSLLIYAVVIGCFTNIFNMFLGLLITEERSKLYSLMTVLSILISQSVSFALIFNWKATWESVLCGQLIGAVLSGLTAYFFLLRYKYVTLDFFIEKKIIKEIFIFTIPIVSRSFFIIVLMLIDRFVVTKVFSLSDTGIYSIGVQFGAIMVYLQDSAIKVIIPWIYAKLSNLTSDNKVKLVQLTYRYYLALLLLSLLMAYLIPFFMKLVLSNDYNRSSKIIFWVVIAYAFNGMTKTMYSILVYYQRTYYSSFITLFVALIHLMLLYFLTKYNGIEGAAQCLTISFFLEFILHTYFVTKVVNLPWVIHFLKKSI